MSIHSADDYEPNLSVPVFGSGVSQTKLQQQQQPNNDLGGAEKLDTPEPTKNGQNDTVSDNKVNESLGNGTKEPEKVDNRASSSTDVHVNGQNGKTDAETVASVSSTTNTNGNQAAAAEEEPTTTSTAPNPVENPSQNASVQSLSSQPTGSAAPTGSEPAISTSADVTKDQLASTSVTDTENAPVSSTEPTSTSSSSNNVPATATVPEATVAIESTKTPEPKSKSPRGKAKSPVVSTPPTRQSSRGRKSATTSSSQNDEEQPATDDAKPSTTSQPEPPSTPKRAKRQAATLATETIPADSSTAEEVKETADTAAVPSAVDEEDDGGDDAAGSKKRKRTPSPRKSVQASTGAGKKRGASPSPPVSASKKAKASPKGKTSSSTNDEQQMDVDNIEATATTTTASASESEPVQTPPKKARTSATRKTPKSSATTPESNEEYKRTHDDAFNNTDNDLISKLNQAVNFCKDNLSFINDTSIAQTPHTFDDVPFADIATQQSDRRAPIQQILLTDYFLRASKLGIQPNVVYTHDKTHASIIDTAVAGRLLLPENCRFLWSDIKNITLLVNEERKYSFIVIDPPWLNKSVRRNRPYSWSEFDDIKHLPVEHLIDRTRPSLICCWSTNCDRVEDFVKDELFRKWNCQYLTTWYWLKVTRSGESVLDLTSADKKSYETLILGYNGDENRFKTLKNTTKIICSVPALIHSVKPALHLLFRNLIDLPKENHDQCLEIYARNLLPNFTSVGNEVLKHQSIDLFEENIA
ncbi:unnamed protein product [Adineta ricciae]|uniref:Methyltransferase-like protein 4 n=1 Tax=Adineta ricciae TaxID=249248 RepID=A0A815FZM4_ADIRI|nr:unnamed protein product [Adineta ricciae]